MERSKNKNETWISVYKPDHPYADKWGYILEHRLKMERKLRRYLQPEEHVHHKDRNRENNHISNLILTTVHNHPRLHKKNLGQVCERCGSIDVDRRGFNENYNQRFGCNNCRFNWTVNKKRGVDYGQICQNCNSNSVKKDGSYNGRQRFHCRNCRRHWSQ